MAEDNTNQETDITKAWQATQGQKSKAKKKRIFAIICWVIALAIQGVAIYLLMQGQFNEGSLYLLIGLLVAIAIFAIGGNLLWKAANRHDPATREEPFRFFVQNQLGAIITIIAFLPLLILIFLDKDMDPKNKQIAGGIGAALAILATVVGIDFNPASVEQYTQDMNQCAAQIRANEPTTACSPEVAEQASEIAKDTETVTEATKTADNPSGQDIVYWIAPKDGATRSPHELVFHLCENVSVLRGKEVAQGSVTEAYAQNAVRLTKQIEMEQRQCGFSPAE